MTLALMNPRIPRNVPATVPAYTGPLAGTYTRSYTIGGIYAGSYPYQVDIPTGYDNAVPAKAMLIMGGSGSRGTDGTSMMSDTLLASIRSAAFPVICIYAQWQASGLNGGREAAWPMVPAIMTQVATEWNVDPLRRYGTGWSLGGLILWETLYANPDLFAGIIIAEAYLNDAAVQGIGATVSPFTHTQAAKVVAQTAPNTAVRQYENLDDPTIVPASTDTARDGYVAAGHTKYNYVTPATGGHDPSNMFAAGGATNYTGWLFTQHL